MNKTGETRRLSKQKRKCVFMKLWLALMGLIKELTGGPHSLGKETGYQLAISSTSDTDKNAHSYTFTHNDTQVWLYLSGNLQGNL